MFAARPGRDGRDRRLGDARGGEDHAPRRDVHRLRPQRLGGRARLRGVLRPVDRPLLGPRDDARHARRAPRARRAAVRRPRAARPAVGLEGAAQRLPPAVPLAAPADDPVPARDPRRPRHGVLVEPDAALEARRGDPAARRRAGSRCARSSSGARSTPRPRTGASSSSATATCACASRISATSRRAASPPCSASSVSPATPR